jgi:ABC-type nickel/cobalt efflux system permease component RcnA
VLNATTTLLLGTAVATALFHTLIPDHWLPFVLIGRVRGWGARTAALVSGFSAMIHAVLSVAIGLAAVGIGVETARVAGETLEHASALLLVTFGIVYAAWAWRKGGHFHPGGHLVHQDGGESCDGAEGAAHPEHLHYHADAALMKGPGRRSAVYLAVIVGLNPCVLILPIMLAALKEGATAVAAVTVAYSVTTIGLMVVLSTAGVMVAHRFFEPPGLARYMETISGLLIALTGVLFWLLES